MDEEFLIDFSFYSKPKTINYKNTICRNFENDIIRIKELDSKIIKHKIVGYATDGDEYTFFLYKTDDKNKEIDPDEDELLFSLSLDILDLKTDPVQKISQYLLNSN